MKHKVICMDCGRTERIEVERGKKIESDWVYWDKINVNACQTDKFHWKVNGSLLDRKNWKKIPNLCYNPEVKPKMVKIWECPECSKKLETQK